MNTSNRLYRSNRDKVIGGVCGGLGDYLNIDPVIVRILFVLLAIFGGSGVLVYIILWIVIPEEIYTFGTEQAAASPENPGNDPKPAGMPAEGKSNNNTMIAGILLIAFGLLILIDRLIPAYNLWDFWPLALVAVGILLIKPELFKTSKKIES
jgi:phage shock protein PspC (stress-responsive transcriptional regulator)